MRIAGSALADPKVGNRKLHFLKRHHDPNFQLGLAVGLGLDALTSRASAVPQLMVKCRARVRVRVRVGTAPRRAINHHATPPPHDTQTQARHVEQCQQYHCSCQPLLCAWRRPYPRGRSESHQTSSQCVAYQPVSQPATDVLSCLVPSRLVSQPKILSSSPAQAYPQAHRHPSPTFAPNAQGSTITWPSTISPIQKQYSTSTTFSPSPRRSTRLPASSIQATLSPRSPTTFSACSTRRASCCACLPRMVRPPLATLCIGLQTDAEGM